MREHEGATVKGKEVISENVQLNNLEYMKVKKMEKRKLFHKTESKEGKVISDRLKQNYQMRKDES